MPILLTTNFQLSSVYTVRVLKNIMLKEVKHLYPEADFQR